MSFFPPIVKNSVFIRRSSENSEIKNFRNILKNTILSKTIPFPTHLPTPANQTLYLVGMFSTANGIGEAARSAYQALSSAGAKVIAVDISSAFDQIDFTSDIPCIQYSSFPYREAGTLLLYMNGAEVLVCLSKLGLKKKYPWKVVGVWVWELPSFPRSWLKALPYVSEIWTYSSFSKEALELQPSDMKVTVVPPPISTIKLTSKNEFDLKIPSKKFILLTMCDARSGVDRKNPLGAIQAFKLAYNQNPDLVLIVKTRNFTENESALRAMEHAISNHEGILWIDKSVSQASIDYLFQKADCFLSLHKSEGFGLALAQAMRIGKPCIASAWSANLDYMDEESALLVPCQKVPLNDNYHVYTCKETYWGEPDVKVASERILEISTDKKLYKSISKQGRLKILSYCDPSTLAKKMMALLTQQPSL